MNYRNPFFSVCGILLVFLTGGSIFAFSTASPLQASEDLSAKLPEGEGKGYVQTLCTSCHGLGNIMGQRKTAEGWEATVSSMLGRISAGMDQEAAIISKYLAENFGVKESPSKSEPSPADKGVGLNTAKIEQLTGAKGKLNEKEGVFKVSVPRSDLAVTAAGVKITPPLGLTSWASFQKAGSQVMVMGDTVLLEDQVNPVMSVALDNGLEVTALHNHFFWDTPKVMFMHIGATGDEDKLASTVGKVFAKIKETSGGKGIVPVADIDPAETSLDPKSIDGTIGATGDMAQGVYKITIGRTTRMHGAEVGNTMGVNTWAAFAGTQEHAVVDGDFVMYEEELQPVLKALRGSGINVVAIHNHMASESPRTMFLHYWGVGAATDLAKGVKKALDAQKGNAQ